MYQVGRCKLTVDAQGAGARPTNDISIEFEIRPKFVLLWFKMYITDHNEILDTLITTV